MGLAARFLKKSASPVSTPTSKTLVSSRLPEEQGQQGHANVHSVLRRTRHNKKGGGGRQESKRSSVGLRGLWKKIAPSICTKTNKISRMQGRPKGQGLEILKLEGEGEGEGKNPEENHNLSERKRSTLPLSRRGPRRESGERHSVVANTSPPSA